MKTYFLCTMFGVSTLLAVTQPVSACDPKRASNQVNYPQAYYPQPYYSQPYSPQPVPTIPQALIPPQAPTMPQFPAAYPQAYSPQAAIPQEAPTSPQMPATTLPTPIRAGSIPPSERELPDDVKALIREAVKEALDNQRKILLETSRGGSTKPTFPDPSDARPATAKSMDMDLTAASRPAISNVERP